MNLRLYDKDRIRIDADHDGDMFIDISQDHYEGISIDIYSHFCMGEIRCKRGILKMFIFKGPEYRADYDFGYWADAEIVYSFEKAQP